MVVTAPVHSPVHDPNSELSYWNSTLFFRYSETNDNGFPVMETSKMWTRCHGPELFTVHYDLHRAEISLLKIMDAKVTPQ